MSALTPPKCGGWTPALAILAGVASSTGLGVITGALAIRRQGIYFAMITLALSQMIYFFYLEAPFTHGEDGIQSVPQGLLFRFLDLSNQTVLYYFVLAVFVFGFLVVYRTINSPFGDILKAIRETPAGNRSGSRLRARQLPQHVGQDAAVADVLDFLGRVDARDCFELAGLAAFFDAHL